MGYALAILGRARDLCPTAPVDLWAGRRLRAGPVCSGGLGLTRLYGANTRSGAAVFLFTLRLTFILWTSVNLAEAALIWGLI